MPVWKTSKDRDASRVGAEAAPAPTRPAYVVGDIHGRADLLDRMISKLDEHWATSGFADASIVFVGDYVDRGEESRKVLGTLMTLAGAGAICLRGNHEDMMLDFLDRPAAAGRGWLRNGGDQTLRSFGIAPPDHDASEHVLTAIRDEFRAALPPGTEAWLRGLPLLWQDGSLVVVHAAADPGKPVDAQDRRTLLWGHRDFLSVPRRDGLWVAHGHTVQEAPSAGRSRIGVDTGAFFSGRLTAACVRADGVVEFVTA